MDNQARDKIHIRDLMCRCIVGINDDERINKQDVIINITMYVDLDAACTSDRIEDTVDYKATKQAILGLVEQSSFFLVERLAQRVAEVCLENSKVEAVTVAIDKPGALRFARSVAVEIHRERKRG
ncbi:MAG: dihydroneopterin aldolase [Candidatus Hydrogenedentes bacterium]|nr:dihydroneopterin aldolase [Candidatus Hydrogenedentota bacterium]